MPFRKERQAEEAGCKRAPVLACKRLLMVHLGRELVEQPPCPDIQGQREDRHTRLDIQRVAEELSRLEPVRSWEEEEPLRLEHTRHTKVEEGLQLAWGRLQGA